MSSNFKLCVKPSIYDVDSSSSWKMYQNYVTYVLNILLNGIGDSYG
jgi:hypothetical protein